MQLQELSKLESENWYNSKDQITIYPYIAPTAKVSPDASWNKLNAPQVFKMYLAVLCA